MPTRTPVVESVSQLTSDSAPKPSHWLQSLETDGSRVYFNEGAFGYWKIVEVGVTGGQAAQISTSLESPAITSLTRDGSSLLVLTMPPGWPTGVLGGSLWFVPLPAGEPRPVPGIEADGATLSPDGRIVYSLGGWINVAEHDGSSPRKLFESSGLDWGPSAPSVSPDAKRVVFVITRKDYGTDIWEMDIDGTNQHRILVGGKDEIPKYIHSPRWTPDGKYLVFLAGGIVGGSVSGAILGRSDLWVLPERGPFRQTPETYERPTLIHVLYFQLRRKTDLCRWQTDARRTRPVQFQLERVCPLLEWHLCSGREFLPGRQVVRVRVVSGLRTVACSW